MLKKNETFEYYQVSMCRCDSLEDAKIKQEKFLNHSSKLYKKEDVKIYKILAKVVDYDKDNNIVYEDVEKTEVKEELTLEQQMIKNMQNMQEKKIRHLE